MKWILHQLVAGETIEVIDLNNCTHTIKTIERNGSNHDYTLLTTTDGAEYKGFEFWRSYSATNEPFIYIGIDNRTKAKCKEWLANQIQYQRREPRWIRATPIREFVEKYKQINNIKRNSL